MRRELGIVLCYRDEYNLSLEILKNNLIQNPSREIEYIMNSKTMGSILHTYIIQSIYRSKQKQYKSALRGLLEAKEFYKKKRTLVNIENPGIIWRRKRINLGLAKRYTYNNFDLANKYFSKAFYKKPSTKREKQHNSIYFLDAWQYFVNLWIKKGKKTTGFIDIFEGDYKNERFNRN